MAAFRRINKVSRFVTGSIESETGSEYLFGYSEADGLMWLERKGVQYSAGDREWGKASAFLRSSFSADGAGEPEVEFDERERTPLVRRSVAEGYDMGAPTHMGAAATSNIGDDDLASRAMAFLSGDTAGFEEPEEYEEVSFEEEGI